MLFAPCRASDWCPKEPLPHLGWATPSASGEEPEG